MESPITWRNINTQVDSAASDLLRGANTSFTSAISGVGNALRDQQGINKANIATGKENNTQAFLDTLSGFATPEQFQAAQAAGTLDKQLQGYGFGIDKERARSAMGNRLGELQSAANTQTEFDKNILMQKVNPLTEQYKGLVLGNKDAEAKAFLEANAGDFNNAGVYSSLAQFGLTRDEKELEMANSAEDRGFAMDERNRLQTDRTLNEALNRTVNQEMASLTQRRATNKQQWDQLATQAGVMVDGAMDLSNPQRVAQFEAAARQAGLTDPTSDTQEINTLRQKLYEGFSTVPGADIEAQLARFTSGLDANAQIANQDTVRMQTVIADAASAAGVVNNSLYIERDQEPVAAVSALIAEKTASDPAFAEVLRGKTQGNRNEFTNSITSAVTNGIDIGKGVKVKFSVADINMALNSFGDDLYGEDEMQELLVKYAKENDLAGKNSQYESFLQTESAITKNFASTVGAPWDARSAAAQLNRAGRNAKAYKASEVEKINQGIIDSRAAQSRTAREEEAIREQAQAPQASAPSVSGAVPGASSRPLRTNLSGASERTLPDIAANRAAVAKTLKNILTAEISVPTSSAEWARRLNSPIN